MLADLTRREALATLAFAAAPPWAAAALRTNDEAVDRLLKAQITDPTNPSRGAYPDENGLVEPHSAAGILQRGAASFLHPDSKFHGDPLLAARLRLAAAFLQRAQNPQGNIDLLITNFNSPPDTGFVVHDAATAACLAARHNQRELLALLEPFLRRAGAGMASGGIHTPNHRWVVCAALAQIHELFPDPSYPRRIDQWLAEGIDIDEEGQYAERSTSVYNPVTDRALVVVAAKLNRPALLEPVRRNLDAMLYMLHPGLEVVTEISRRQDQYQRADMGRYWFPLRYLAVRDGRGEFAGIAARFPSQAALSALMEYPELLEPGPAPAPLPEDYEKLFPRARIARIRRGLTSATLILGANSRFLTLRRGEAVVNAVRFASAFFGKAQFVPTQAEKRGASYHFSQSLEADYVQPLDRRVAPEDWESVKPLRRRSEICRLRQSAEVTELPAGFRVRCRAEGIAGVPLAVEINLREGGQLEGCEERAPGTFLFSGPQARYRAGADTIRFGPGRREHAYTQVRGAEPKLPGPSVYLTGYTPFDHAFTFEWE